MAPMQKNTWWCQTKWKTTGAAAPATRGATATSAAAATTTTAAAAT